MWAVDKQHAASTLITDIPTVVRRYNGNAVYIATHAYPIVQQIVHRTVMHDVTLSRLYICATCACLIPVDWVASDQNFMVDVDI